MKFKALEKEHPVVLCILIGFQCISVGNCGGENYKFTDSLISATRCRPIKIKHLLYYGPKHWHG